MKVEPRQKWVSRISGNPVNVVATGYDFVLHYEYVVLYHPNSHRETRTSLDRFLSAYEKGKDA